MVLVLAELSGLLITDGRFWVIPTVRPSWNERAFLKPGVLALLIGVSPRIV